MSLYIWEEKSSEIIGVLFRLDADNRQGMNSRVLLIRIGPRCTICKNVKKSIQPRSVIVSQLLYHLEVSVRGKNRKVQLFSDDKLKNVAFVQNC